MPWLALIGLGGYWLWQHGWLYQGMGILSANIALVYGSAALAQAQRKTVVCRTH